MWLVIWSDDDSLGSGRTIFTGGTAEDRARYYAEYLHETGAKFVELFQCKKVARWTKNAFEVDKEKK